MTDDHLFLTNKDWRQASELSIGEKVAVMDIGAKLGSEIKWDVISGISEIFLPRVARVTVTANHNFVANGFVVHNCGPCHLAAPIIEELSETNSGKVKVGKLDVDANPQMAQKFGVMSIPTVILYRDGKEVARQVGYAGKAGYENLVKKGLGE